MKKFHLGIKLSYNRLPACRNLEMGFIRLSKRRFRSILAHFSSIVSSERAKPGTRTARLEFVKKKAKEKKIVQYQLRTPSAIRSRKSQAQVLVLSVRRCSVTILCLLLSSEFVIISILFYVRKKYITIGTMMASCLSFASEHILIGNY